MKVLVTGDRNWTDREKIKEALLKVQKLAAPNERVFVIQGGCRGADTIAKELAEELPGFEPITFPADWTKYGKAAGPIRNQQMLDEGKPDCALAFHPDLTKSKGTRDMVDRLKAAKIPCGIVT